MRTFLSGLKVLVVAVLVNALANPTGLRLLQSRAEAAPPSPGYDVPGFGGATAPPRMLVIMDTSKSMSSTPDMTQNLPLEDYDGEADSIESPPICGEDPDATLYPKARSYYMGDEMAGKPRVFMPYVGGVRGYRRILEKVRDGGYDGLEFSPVRATV